jgi:DNA-binding transcriptional ArsR family regulator
MSTLGCSRLQDDPGCFATNVPENSELSPHGVRMTKAHGGMMMVSKKLFDNAEAAAELLTLIGNEKRLAIMVHLLEGEMTVGAIAEKVSLSQSALSQHLAKLRALGLVETRRDRQMIYYSCKSDAVRKVLHTLDGIFGDA